MTDTEIGRVIAVDTAEVTVELNADLKGMTRSTYEGPQEVGQINSYVIMPAGVCRLVAIVTRVALVDETELKSDRTLVTLPRSRRLIRATLIGTIEGTKFRQGVSVFPVLDCPVYLAQKQDLDAIFGPADLASECVDAEDPGFCIPIGESTVIKGRIVRINPDVFFGKHAAVLGSTGSGKSCTIASLIQSILEQPTVKRTTIIILDTNGEYRSAFQYQADDDTWHDTHYGKCLYIPSDQTQPDRLVIPYWFLNAEDFVRLFQAAKGVQRPVLLEALRLARNEAREQSRAEALRAAVLHELDRILARVDKDDRVSAEVRSLAVGLSAFVSNKDCRNAWRELERQCGITKDGIIDALEAVRAEVEKYIERYARAQVLPIDSRKAIHEAIDPIYEALAAGLLDTSHTRSVRSADTPSYFDKFKFRSRYLEQVLRREESGGPRAREYSGTMLLRIDRLLADARFEFLFGSSGSMLPDAENVLAAFLRDILGIGSSAHASLSDTAAVSEQVLPFYDRQRHGASAANVVVLDLSLLAAEVLENVTAVIGRLILEFLQRLGEHGGGHTRGSLPVVLVLEEAQNYIPEPRSVDEESIARIVFERIAREGRKYGLGLVVASQRPSELSRTVLSQCSSFIVHRLQNPEDLRYFKEIVPAIYGPLLEQIPALAPQTALVLGECVASPALVRIRDARPVPRSRDPRFYKYWTGDQDAEIPVEAVCAEWEGRDKSLELSTATTNSSA